MQKAARLKEMNTLLSPLWQLFMPRRETRAFFFFMRQRRGRHDALQGRVRALARPIEAPLLVVDALLVSSSPHGRDGPLRLLGGLRVLRTASLRGRRASLPPRKAGTDAASGVESVAIESLSDVTAPFSSVAASGTSTIPPSPALSARSPISAPVPALSAAARSESLCSLSPTAVKRLPPRRQSLLSLLV